MRKFYGFLFAVIMFLSFSGCAQHITVSSNTSKDEALLMSALTNTSYKYGYHGAEGYWMTLWLERYKYGELTESIPNILSCSCSESGGQIIFYTDRTSDPKEPEMLNAVILQDGVISNKSDILQFDLPDAGRFSQYPAKYISLTDGRIVLLFVEYHEDAANEVEPEFFTNYRDHLDAIAKMPNVLLLGCEFTTEQPEITE